MNKILLTLATTVATLAATAQFLDDFEGYTVGTYLAATSPDWDTWDGAPSGSDDVQVTNTDAHSGTNSIYFASSTASGGPQDVVLPFGGAYNTGNFVFEMWMRVEANKGAYFNFQADATPGQVWALETFFIDDGNLLVVSDAANVITGTYPANTWFKVTWNIDLDVNNWELLIDGVSKGSFANTNNQIASLDLFPVNNQPGANNMAGYWCDDVAYTYTPTNLPALNAATINVTPNIKLVGQTGHPKVTIRNLGQTAITSFHLELTYNSNTISEDVSGVNIASLATHVVEFGSTITGVGGNLSMTATVSQVNGGGADGNPADDTKIITVTTITPAAGKMVVAEEATGTWCGWCPRGTVAMAGMQETYAQFWAGIAVHNNDPMVHAAYDAGIGPLISGYPSALVDRGGDVDPTQIEAEFLNNIQVAPTALVKNTATFDPVNNKVNVHVDVTFQSSASGDWRIALAATEHGVSGVASGYAQVNYYSYQANDLPLVGAGRDWQAAPNPVPANEMVYDHVARLITPAFDGQTGAFPSSINANDTFDFDFEIAIDPAWEKDNMEFIAMIIAPGGSIDNADKTLGAYTWPVAVEQITEPAFTLHPNPASDEVILTISGNQQALIAVTDMMGRMSYEVKPALNGNQVILPLSELASGVYLVSVKVGNTVSARTLVVE